MKSSRPSHFTFGRRRALRTGDCGRRRVMKQIGKHPERVFTYERQADRAGQHQRMVPSHQTRRVKAFPLSQLKTRLGKLACAIGYAVVRAARVGRVGNRAHGATLCASQRRASGAACGAYGRTFGHVLGNTGKQQQKAVRRYGRMTLFPRQNLVAKGGIEPPTHGFSV
jgi:hypothetical protein